MKDCDLPKEIVDLYSKKYKGKYYSGWWEIVDHETNVCDQYESCPMVRNNELTIVLHPIYRNSKTYYHFFKIKDNKVELNVLGTRGNGRDLWFKTPPYCKNKINKVIKWLEEQQNESKSD